MGGGDKRGGERREERMSRRMGSSRAYTLHLNCAQQACY